MKFDGNLSEILRNGMGKKMKGPQLEENHSAITKLSYTCTCMSLLCIEISYEV